MVPANELVCAADLESAQGLLAKNPEYDVIPIKENKNIIAFCERGDSVSRRIKLYDLVSDATSIIDLIDVFIERVFVFVLSQQKVDGYVHFSDLNKPLVKLPFFVLLESLERHVSTTISGMVAEDTLSKILDHERYGSVIKRMAKMREDRADLDWTTLLYFKEMLLCARHLGKLRIDISEIDMLAKTRNLVTHAASPDALVESHQDVKRLLSAKQICASILQHHE